MRMMLVLVMTACSDSSDLPTQDAYVDRFGEPCVDDMTAPLTTCESDVGEAGWCINSGSDANGVCRRGCVAGSCPFGQATPVYDDCFCQP